jgi:hypothetical protein
MNSVGHNPILKERGGKNRMNMLWIIKSAHLKDQDDEVALLACFVNRLSSRISDLLTKETYIRMQ